MQLSRTLIPLLAAVALLISWRGGWAAIEGNVWVSLDSDGNQHNSASGAYSYPPALNDGGTLVALESLAPLVFDADANGLTDVFVRNIEEAQTFLVSANSAGEIGNGRSFGPSMSGDGTLVAFESLATNLAEGDANNASDVYLRDMEADSTVRVSASSSGDSDGASYRPAISADGGWVAFCSRATNLTSDDSNGIADVFLWERATGAISRIAVPALEEGANDGCLRVALSADAGVLAFAAVTGGMARIYVYDRSSGATTAVTPEANGPSGTGGVAVSGDGRLVAFDSVADNLIAEDTNRSRDVFVYDRTAGSTVRESVRTSGSQLPGNSGASGISISRDGRFLVFGSTAKGVVPGDSNGREDIFRRDLIDRQTLIASVNVFGESANNSSYSPSVNADGSVVAFTSMAANLVSGDANRQPDVYVRGAPFPEKAGSASGPEETGAPVEEEETAPIQTEDGSTSWLVYGAIAAGVLGLLIGGSLFLGRRGRA